MFTSVRSGATRRVPASCRIYAPAVDLHSSPEAVRQALEQVRTNRSFNALGLVDSAFNCVL
ncbi:hypothetical protein CN231_17775 [Sinorhizobium meliloti]|nr:hypothetical protein CN231_17775 [Sinorhizobium meliloti]